MTARHVLLAATAALAVGAAAATTATAAPAPSTAPALGATAAADAASGTYRPVAPTRLLDTRSSGAGGTAAPLGAGGAVDVQVSGRATIPTSGVSGVLLNITAVGPSASTYLRVYPTGATPPNVSTLNVAPGVTRANSVVAALGTGGKVRILNAAGTTHVIVDAVGYYNALGSGRAEAAEYAPFARARLYDSRYDDGGTPLAPGETVVQSLDIEDPADPTTTGDNARVRAFAVNVTAVGGTTTGFFTVWSGTGTLPNTSSVNFTAGQIVPNFVTAPAAVVGGLPQFAVINRSTGSTHVIVDLVGAYLQDDPEANLRYRPLTARRVVDTRSDLGITDPLGPGAVKTATVGSPVNPVSDFVLVSNLTAVGATARTFLTAWENGQALPNPGSDVNAAAGETAANAALIPISDAGRFNVRNNAGTTNVLVDVFGTFEFPNPPAPAPGTRAAAPSGDRVADRAVTVTTTRR
jgi:hypothetical protein